MWPLKFISQVVPNVWFKTWYYRNWPLRCLTFDPIIQDLPILFSYGDTYYHNVWSFYLKWSLRYCNSKAKTFNFRKWPLFLWPTLSKSNETVFVWWYILSASLRLIPQSVVSEIDLIWPLTYLPKIHSVCLPIMIQIINNFEHHISSGSWDIVITGAIPGISWVDLCHLWPSYSKI